MPLVVDAGVVPDVDDAHFCRCDVLKKPTQQSAPGFVQPLKFCSTWKYKKRKKRERKMERIYCSKKSKHKFVFKKKKKWFISHCFHRFSIFWHVIVEHRSIFATSSTISLSLFFFFPFNSKTRKIIYFTTSRVFDRKRLISLSSAINLI